MGSDQTAESAQEALHSLQLLWAVPLERLAEVLPEALEGMLQRPPGSWSHADQDPAPVLGVPFPTGVSCRHQAVYHTRCRARGDPQRAG